MLPVTPPNGIYKYVSEMNGARIAQTAITVTRDTSGNVVLSESGSGQMNGQSGSITDTLTLAPTLAPLQYTTNASIADSRNMQANLAFDGTRAVLSGDVDKTFALVQGAKHFVVLDFGPFTGYFALPAQMQAWSDTPAVAIMPIFAQDWPIAIDKSMTPQRPKDVPADDAQISIATPVQLTVWYDPSTYVVDRVDIPSENLIVTREQ